MLKIGQSVWHRDGRRIGTVLECSGGRVYIAQDNGAEVDFRAEDLTATAPEAPNGLATAPAAPNGLATAPAAPNGLATAPAAPNGLATAPAAPNDPAKRALKAADMTPEHAKVLRAIPPRTLQAVAALFEARPHAGKFNALDLAGKLNVVAELTAIPYRTMRQYSDRPGELGLLMGKGLADSRGPG